MTKTLQIDGNGEMIDDESTDVEDTQAIIDDLRAQIEATEKKRDDRVNYCRDYIMKSFDSAETTYKTANGVMHCLKLIQEIYPDTPDMVCEASKLSESMVTDVNRIRKKFEELEQAEYFVKKGSSETHLMITIYKNILGYLNELPVPIAGTDFGHNVLAAEILKIEIAKQIGSIVDEMIEFLEAVDEGINKLKEELAIQEAKLND